MHCNSKATVGSNFFLFGQFCYFYYKLKQLPGANLRHIPKRTIMRKNYYMFKFIPGQIQVTITLNHLTLKMHYAQRLMNEISRNSPFCLLLYFFCNKIRRINFKMHYTHKAAVLNIWENLLFSRVDFTGLLYQTFRHDYVTLSKETDVTKMKKIIS